ncbi:hypothetical protein Q5P01_022071 [Channa striata]|uniref:Uncharacterized protein n=1 Tax=Channa striata TaxID=64152 RepID=A0AA88IYZ2_CHASR|nr:hypothetical protein Q5P01_022071 [Channa striata]
MGMLVNSAVHKTKGSQAENSRPEKKVKTEDAESTDISAARHTSSSGFLVNLLVVPMDGSHWDLESWVSGEHGFVVFTLGSMVSDMPEETSSVFLEAFKRISQKVIWRYTGQVPNNVTDNVKIMKWVPQKDLLAHPGVRAFITHVTMVMLPLIADQPDNALKLASRGAGVVLDIYALSTENLL